MSIPHVLCRLCGVRKPNTKYLFCNEILKERILMKINHLFKEILCISKNDKYSKFICSDCELSTHQFFEFWEMVQNVQKNIPLLLQGECSEQDSMAPNVDDYDLAPNFCPVIETRDTSQIVLSGKHIYEKSYLNKESDDLTRGSLKNQNNFCQINSSQTFTEKLDGLLKNEKLPLRYDTVVHNSTHQFYKDEENIILSKEKNVVKMYDLNEEMNVRFRSAKPVCNPACIRNDSTGKDKHIVKMYPYDLNSEIKMTDTNRKECSCENHLNTQTNITKNTMSSFHSKLSEKLTELDRSINNEKHSLLVSGEMTNMHMKKAGTLKNEKYHVCEICHRKFNHKGHLNRHTLVHKKDVREHLCDICGMSFNQKSTLNTHFIHLHGKDGDLIPAYECAWCGQTYKYKMNLKSHLLTHHNANGSLKTNFYCKMCDKYFISISNLTVHLKIHSAQKKIQCSVCGKVFSQQNNLNAHLKKHEWKHLT